MISVVEQVEERRCLDARGKPLCGAEPEGALVVERLTHVTCQACIAVTNVPMTRLARGGDA